MYNSTDVMALTPASHSALVMSALARIAWIAKISRITTNDKSSIAGSYADGTLTG